MVHNGQNFNLLVVIKNLETRILEHIKEQSYAFWKAPPPGAIKLNVDAATLRDKAFIAVIARDYGGSIIKAWAKQTVHLDPTVAEASAIVWALELAMEEGFENIIVESDAKICVDALNCPIDESPWKIHALSTHSLDLALNFSASACVFLWVRRDANQMAHALAKVASSLPLPFSCFCNSLPPSAVEAWTRDLLSL